MGRLMYGTPPTELDVDDRVLAHIQVIILNKFRRNESFAFHLDAQPERGIGRQSLWLHPSIPLQFSFYGSRMPALNPEWLRLLADEANTGRGLHICPEPVSARQVAPAQKTTAA